MKYQLTYDCGLSLVLTEKEYHKLQTIQKRKQREMRGQCINGRSRTIPLRSRLDKYTKLIKILFYKNVRLRDIAAIVDCSETAIFNWTRKNHMFRKKFGGNPHPVGRWMKQVLNEDS